MQRQLARTDRPGHGGVFGEASLDPRNVVAYLCGSPAMIDDVTSLLASLGVPSEAIVSERYWTIAA